MVKCSVSRGLPQPGADGGAGGPGGKVCALAMALCVHMVSQR